MGGAVSSGRDNDEFIDNLMDGNYIKSRNVELAFRGLDRGDYILPEAWDQAYKDLAWRSGALHMSAPCIYSAVMEGLELRPGLSFLNIGSGTGYLSTMVGLILGSGGINHGIEVHPQALEYSIQKLKEFISHSPTLDDSDFCEPKFFLGNALCLAPLQATYDRVYVGAACPDEYLNYVKQLIKVGGILVMPMNRDLLHITRVSENGWRTRSLLKVSFATLRVPFETEARNLFKIDELSPPRLQVLARASVRAALRRRVLARQPHLAAPASVPRSPRKSCPRRICIPIDDDSDNEDLNGLHDLDPENGAHEMNALLSLVLNMGQNQVAGAIRFDPDSSVESSSNSSDEEEWHHYDGLDLGPLSEGEEGEEGAEAAGREPAGAQPDGAQPDEAQPDGARLEGAEPAGEAAPEPANPLPGVGEAAGARYRSLLRALTGQDPLGPHAARNELLPRGRLSLTFEYNEPAPPAPPAAPAATAAPAAPAAPGEAGGGPVELVAPDDISPPPSDIAERSRGPTRRERKRHSQCSNDDVLERNDEGSGSSGAGPGAEGSPTSTSEEEVSGRGEGEGGDRTAKRKKVDSGIGADSPSSSSTPDALKSDDSPSDDDSEVEPDTRRLPNDSCSSSEELDGPGVKSAGRGRGRRPRSAPRREHLATLMRHAVAALPLPPPLCVYVNWCRPLRE